MSSDFLPYKTPEEAKASVSKDPEARSLEADSELRAARVSRATLTNILRRKAFEHSIAVCLGMAFYLFLMVLLVIIGKPLNHISDVAQVAIFGGPVIAITLITIFLIRGVFLAAVADAKDDEASLLSPVVKATTDNLG